MSKIDTGGESLTAQDYFASQALQGLISAGEIVFASAQRMAAHSGKNIEDVMAESAYEYARAMIAEKRKREAST